MATNAKFSDTKCKRECRAMETKMESSVGGKINCYSTLETIFALVLFYFH